MSMKWIWDWFFVCGADRLTPDDSLTQSLSIDGVLTELVVGW